MKFNNHVRVLAGIALLGAWSLLGSLAHAASPTAAQALKLTPTQDGVDYDRPKADELPRCKIVAETIDGHVGWVVQGPEGNVLRRFADTNGDNIVDQWSYFKDGIEVYRDIATKSAGKADQFRWLNTAGGRWGEDVSGSGRLERWRVISAEETSAEIVAAIARRDVARFNRVLLTSAELASLGLGKAKTAVIEAKIAKASDDFKALLNRQQVISSNSHWLQFGGNRPCVVPAGTDESTKDVEVYENAIAVFESGDQHGQIQIGTLVHVDKVWKVIDAPALAGDTATVALNSGVIIQPSTGGARGSLAPEHSIPELDALDPSDPKAIEIVANAAEKAKSSEDKTYLYRQWADRIAAAVQSGKMPDGNKQLRALFEKIQANGSDKNLEAYVKIRLLSAEYSSAIQAPNADVAAIQVKWLKDLEQFIADYPSTPDTAEAMLQLGIARENAGQDDDAKKWYERIAHEFHDAPQAKKASGAVARLDSVGKVLRLSGAGLDGGTVDLSSYRGRVVVVQYWATWSAPAKTDIDKLKKLAAQFGNSLAVIGVSLDNSPKEVQTWLKENPLPWPQIYEEGGQDSRPANALGIITVPTMIVVDADGKVVDRNAQMAELESTVKKLVR